MPSRKHSKLRAERSHRGNRGADLLPTDHEPLENGHYAADADDTGGPWLLSARCCAALAAGEAQTATGPLPTREATLAALACALLLLPMMPVVVPS